MLCLGSNTSARQMILSNAIARLACMCDILKSSSVYEAPDDSGLGAPYLNVVMKVTTRFTLYDFRACLKSLEQEFGRNELSKSTGCMPLDVDIILWDSEIVDRYQYSKDYFQKGFAELATDL